ncbi:MAG: NAD-dependent epimerase/dehydratase family protein, partial [Phycisphaerales bacterium]|nr:NAD-dependent epimerase/dehydratase family protein [Phycisphaerales bacterium]
MTVDRRRFLQQTMAGATALGLSGLMVPRVLRAADEVKRAEKPMRILVLGGTTFLGPAVVRYALERGHDITLFNRGKTRTSLFPNVTKLRGDRNGDLESLKGGEWDAVVDTAAKVPRWVRTAAEVLQDSVGQYVFVSSISAYADPSRMGLKETDAEAVMEDESVEQVTGETYGPLKVLCERAAESAFPGRATSIRPGLIVGPEDPTDRFTYWPVWMRRGGE